MKTGIETERKYVILKPDINVLATFPDFTESYITQTYLSSEAEVTRRVRRRVSAGKMVYTETVKRRISPSSALESEREIGESEYFELTKKIKGGTVPIEKIRYTFSYSGKLFEVDFYPEWIKSCIMEIELKSEDEEIGIPTFIKIIREVTGRREYSNASMSHIFPTELV